jgi:HlyD family secretion protein/adhesin transport system membrane fusion protein
MNAPQNIQSGRPSDTPEWLTTPIEFEEQRGFRVSRATMRLLVVLSAAALLWAALAPIRELSLARGQLVPTSQIRPVQHLEGGVVEDILVEPGQVVEKGQPLMRLQEVLSDSDLSALRVRAHNLALLKERLDALITGRAADFSALGKLNAALTAEHH